MLKRNKDHLQTTSFLQKITLPKRMESIQQTTVSVFACRPFGSVPKRRGSTSCCVGLRHMESSMLDVPWRVLTWYATKTSSGWWFQPIWKICSSKWVHLPPTRCEHKKMFELPPPSDFWRIGIPWDDSSPLKAPPFGEHYLDFFPTSVA